MGFQNLDATRYSPEPGPDPRAWIERPAPSWGGLARYLAMVVVLGGLTTLAHDAWRDLREAQSPPGPRPQSFAALRLPSGGAGPELSDATAEPFSERATTPQRSSPNLSSVPAETLPQPAAPGSPTVFDCAVAGRTAHPADGDCVSGRRSTPVVEPGVPAVAVPLPPAPAADPRRLAVAVEAPGRRQQDALARPQAVEAAAETGRQQVAVWPAPCAATAQQVEPSDALARQPPSGTVQDRLRVDRERVRSRQAELRC